MKLPAAVVWFYTDMLIENGCVIARVARVFNIWKFTITTTKLFFTSIEMILALKNDNIQNIPLLIKVILWTIGMQTNHPSHWQWYSRVILSMMLLKGLIGGKNRTHTHTFFLLRQIEIPFTVFTHKLFPNQKELVILGKSDFFRIRI